jgi:hypothetical protein
MTDRFQEASIRVNASWTFAIVDGVLFKPLRYERPEELFRLGRRPAAERREPYAGGSALSMRDIEDLTAAVPGARFALYADGFGDEVPGLAAVGSSVGQVRGQTRTTKNR